MKKLLYVIETMGVGGAERLLVTMANELTEFEVHIIVLTPPFTLNPELRPGVKLTCCEFRPNKDFIKITRFLRQYIRKEKIDIIHSHLFWPNIYCRLATPRRVRLINHIHAVSSLASYKVNRKSLWVEKLTYRKRHHLVAVSNEVLTDFDKWIGIRGKSTCIYNNIDDKFFEPRPPKTFSEKGLRLVAVGNLRWQKNYPYLLDAFKKMPEGVTLDIYGKPEKLYPVFQEIIETNKISVKLCGVVDNIPELLPQYDGFIMSSFYEGFSLGLMEAMASGLPCLLSDVPVLREAGGDVAVYFSLDNPDDAVARVQELLADRSRLPVMAEQGIRRAAKLAKKEALLKSLRDLYAEAY